MSYTSLHRPLRPEALDEIAWYGFRAGRAAGVINDDHMIGRAADVLAEFGVMNDLHPSWDDAADAFCTSYHVGAID